jgi:hypothetical protein
MFSASRQLEFSVGKVIAGAIAGYVVMFVAVFLLMTLGWMALGAGGSFQPGSWETTSVWVVVTLVVDVVAALGGGYVAMLIAKRPLGPQLLAGLVVVLGLLMSIPMFTAGTPALGPRPDVVTMMDAMSKAQQPLWLVIANPILGAVFALVGGRLRKGPAQQG